jgi:charged multivesicular body protein 5
MSCIQSIHYDMEGLIEQANEIQESLSRTYGVPEELDEADLQAGSSCFGSSQAVVFVLNSSLVISYAELDALGDELANEESEIPSYLREDTTQLPDFIDEAPSTNPATSEVRFKPFFHLLKDLDADIQPHLHRR